MRVFSKPARLRSFLFKRYYTVSRISLPSVRRLVRRRHLVGMVFGSESRYDGSYDRSSDLLLRTSTLYL